MVPDPNNLGIRRIVDYFKSENLPIPEFRNISNGFMVTVFGKEDGDRVTDKVTEKVTDKVGDRVGDNLTKNQNLILSIIQTKQTISALELSKRIGISKRKIEENIRKLKDLGILKRISPAKGGHWEIR